MKKTEILTEEGKIMVGLSILLSLCCIFLIVYFYIYIFSVGMIVFWSMVLSVCIYDLIDTYIKYIKIKRWLNK